MESIIKYLKTRGYNCTEFYKLFHELDYYLRNCSDGMNKKALLYDLIGKIGQKLTNPTGNPIDRLKELYEDIRHAYYNLNRENLEMLTECFNEIAALQPEMEKVGGVRYNYYSQLLQQLGRCDAILIHVANLDNPRVLPKELLTNLRTEFSNLFSAMQRVITPPVRIEIPREELVGLVREGVPLTEIAKATGYDEETLRMILAQAKMEAGGSETS